MTDPHAQDQGTDDEPVRRVRKIESEPVEPVDVMAVAGGAVARRLIPVAVVVALAAVVVLVLRQRS